MNNRLRTACRIIRSYAAVILLIARVAIGSPIHTHGMDLSADERARLERSAAGGDANAAWRLYLYHGLEYHDESAADPWLRRAALLKHPEAERMVADMIKQSEYPWKQFGSSRQNAEERLLISAARTSGNACEELASAYADGSCGAKNFEAARKYFRKGAEMGNRMCWEALGKYLHAGNGGVRDDAEAYYWISVEARCVDPRSVGGETTWKLREEIAAQLPIRELKKQWARIDAYIAQVRAGEIVVDSAPFLNRYIKKQLAIEGQRLADEREQKHRNTLRRRGS